MNRRKLILLWSGLESMLLAMLLVLFFSHRIGIYVFLGCVVSISLLSLAVLMLIIRRTSN